MSPAIDDASNSMFSFRIRSCCLTCWNQFHSIVRIRFSAVVLNFVEGEGEPMAELMTGDPFVAVKLFSGAVEDK